MSCNNCRNCYYCLSNVELARIYDEVMNIPLYDRIKFGCNCYMCNDDRSASCIEIELMNSDFNFETIRNEIDLIKQQIKRDNKTLLRIYILCLFRFNKLYEEVIHRRYTPPNGKGYLESKKRFDNLRYINTENVLEKDDDICAEYFQYKIL